VTRFCVTAQGRTAVSSGDQIC